MIDPIDIPDALTELPPELRARRIASARRRRRRRRLLGLVVVAVIAGGGVVAALALSSRESSSGGSSQASAQHEASQPHGAQTGYPTDWQPYTGPVPILEYHAIQDPIPGSAYPELFVTQEDFQRQMAWLRDQGYEGVTLDQVEKAWYEDGELPPKPVVISFDDGYESQYVVAFPFLKQLGWPGVLNLKAGTSDLSDEAVRAMLDADPPWELASHTITHVDLTTVDSTQLEQEVAGSRRVLERKFDVSVHNFCYPAGRFDDTVVAAVQRAGYRGATTEIPGLATAQHPLTLARLEITNSDGLDGFVSKLKTAQPQSSTEATTTTSTTTG